MLHDATSGGEGGVPVAVDEILRRRNNYRVISSDDRIVVEVRRDGLRTVAYAGRSYGEARQAARRLADMGLVGYVAT